MTAIQLATIAAQGFAGFAIVVGTMIIFGKRSPPPPLDAMNDGGLDQLEAKAMHELKNFAARDGTQLAYREFLAASEQVAILVHGSSADGRAMLAIGHALASQGISAYAIDMRGHGASGRRGDIEYIGQLEDDIVDLVAHLRQTHPHAQFSLIGHSSGGGFSLRFACGKAGALFERYILAAPFIHHAVATTRPGSGGWAKPFLARIIGLSILHTMGLRWFQHLPVLAFAVPSGRDDLTAFYSFRLQTNFRPDTMKWKEQLKNLQRPVKIIVGANDELFIAEAYEGLLTPLSPQVSVQVLPALGHTDIYAKPAALQAIVSALRS